MVQVLLFFLGVIALAKQIINAGMIKSGELYQHCGGNIVFSRLVLGISLGKLPPSKKVFGSTFLPKKVEIRTPDTKKENETLHFVLFLFYSIVISSLNLIILRRVFLGNSSVLTLTMVIFL